MQTDGKYMPHIKPRFRSRLASVACSPYSLCYGTVNSDVYEVMYSVFPSVTAKKKSTAV